MKVRGTMKLSGSWRTALFNSTWYTTRAHGINWKLITTSANTPSAASTKNRPRHPAQTQARGANRLISCSARHPAEDQQYAGQHAERERVRQDKGRDQQEQLEKQSGSQLAGHQIPEKIPHHIAHRQDKREHSHRRRTGEKDALEDVPLERNSSAVID